MTVTLTGPAEEFIQRLVAEGSYEDATKAVQAACFMWMQEARAAETPEWREYVQHKIAEAAQGSFRRMNDQDVGKMLDGVRRSVGLPAKAVENAGDRI